MPTARTLAVCCRLVCNRFCGWNGDVRICMLDIKGLIVGFLALENICALPLFCHAPAASNAAGGVFSLLKGRMK